jgi:hypothetical protein
MLETLPYTVVGVYPDNLNRADVADATYVEWVEAESPEDAVDVAQSLDPDRVEGAAVVAVFSGYVEDKLFDKGASSTEEPCLTCGAGPSTFVEGDCPKCNPPVGEV